MAFHASHSNLNRGSDIERHLVGATQAAGAQGPQNGPVSPNAPHSYVLSSLEVMDIKPEAWPPGSESSSHSCIFGRQPDLFVPQFPLHEMGSCSYLFHGVAVEIEWKAERMWCVADTCCVRGSCYDNESPDSGRESMVHVSITWLR